MATILLVEDNPTTRELLIEFLGHEHTVLEAATGLEAVTVARGARPDLILLDLKLPDAHGFDIARRLREESPTAGIPIVALTAYPKELPAEALAKSGCTGYLTKPISRELLQEALQHYLAGG